MFARVFDAERSPPIKRLFLVDVAPFFVLWRRICVTNVKPVSRSHVYMR